MCIHVLKILLSTSSLGSWGHSSPLLPRAWFAPPPLRGWRTDFRSAAVSGPLEPSAPPGLVRPGAGWWAVAETGPHGSPCTALPGTRSRGDAARRRAVACLLLKAVWESAWIPTPVAPGSVTYSGMSAERSRPWRGTLRLHGPSPPDTFKVLGSSRCQTY